MMEFNADMRLFSLCWCSEGECVAGFAGNLTATLVQFNLATEEVAVAQATSAAQQLALVVQAFASWG